MKIEPSSTARSFKLTIRKPSKGFQSQSMRGTNLGTRLKIVDFDET